MNTNVTLARLNETKNTYKRLAQLEVLPINALEMNAQGEVSTLDLKKARRRNVGTHSKNRRLTRQFARHRRQDGHLLPGCVNIRAVVEFV